jgi:hypothetical protein
MKEEAIQAMIIDYLEGNLNEDQLIEFHQLMKQGLIKAEDLESIKLTISTLSELPEPQPPASFGIKFNTMLSAEIENQEMNKNKFTWSYLILKLAEIFSPARFAYTILIFMIGFGFSSLMDNQKKSDTDVQMLSKELGEVKQLLFTTLIEQPAAVDRLKAVNISQQISETDDVVIEALIKSLNNDPNVNVRLAAVEVLKNHTSRPEVRENLILSINLQDSPMVQIALADLMKSLQEKKAVPHLERLLKDENTNEFVKEKLKEAIVKI